MIGITGIRIELKPNVKNVLSQTMVTAFILSEAISLLFFYSK